MFFVVNIHAKGKPKTIESADCTQDEIGHWVERGKQLANEHGKTMVVSFKPREHHYEVNPDAKK